GSLGKCMVAPRDAPCDLKVDDSLRDAVAADHLADDDPERPLRDRHLQPDRTERSSKALEMTWLPEGPAAADRDHLVDSVGELISAVLHMDHGIAKRDIAAVDIGGARHGGRFRNIRAARRTASRPCGSRAPRQRRRCDPWA